MVHTGNIEDAEVLDSAPATTTFGYCYAEASRSAKKQEL